MLLIFLIAVLQLLIGQGLYERAWYENTSSNATKGYQIKQPVVEKSMLGHM